MVAQEVKALADHSIQASQEVTRILGYVENRIEQAFQTAESGYQETQAALAVAQGSGLIMRQLLTVIEQNNLEMERIEKAAGLMNTQTSEISLATNQQYTASVLGVEKLQLIGTIATQAASGSSQVSSSTRNLEDLAKHLLGALH